MRAVIKKYLASTAVAALLCVALPVYATAQETLSSALTAAYETNPDLAAARKELMATNETYNQAISNWRPQISSFATYGQTDETNSRAFTGAKEERNPRTYGLSAQQPIYRGGRTTAATKAAEATIERGRALLLDREQQVLLATVTAYMDVVQAQAVLNVNNNNVQVLKRNLEATQDRFRVGEVTLTDVAQAESRLAKANSDVTEATGTLNSARAAYERVVGRIPGELQRPDILLTLPINLDDAVTTSRKEAPRVLAAMGARDAAEQNVREAKGSILPEVRLEAQAQSAEDTSVLGGTTDTMSLTGRLTLPLYQSGAEYSQVRQAQQTFAQRRSEMLNEERSAVEATIRAWNTLQTARAQIESFNSQIKAAEVALDGVRQEAVVGSRTVIDVLDAEQELLNARVNLIRTEREEVVAQYTLLSAIGRLNAASLALPTTLYDAKTEFDTVKGQWIGFADTDTVD
ncbi:MAG: TolC family outer membrane protein [Holosporales bacterium]